MISVLIPIYNYNVTKLVEQLHYQLVESDIKFEIICLEDGSDDELVKSNKSLEHYKNVIHKIELVNVGRIMSRQKLVSLSTFEWLLFLDADVKIIHKEYIRNYLKIIPHGYEAIFGGFTYNQIPPNDEYTLRWKYGRSKEEVLSKNRNLKPYKVVISANYLILKSTFNSIYGQINFRGYGYDNFFGSSLKQNKVKILHIDNEVFHLGLDSNSDFLEKTREAVKNLFSLYKDGDILESDNTLLHYFKSAKRYRINFVIASIYKNFKGVVEKNLLSKSPSINLFQFYKLGYICHLDLRK